MCFVADRLGRETADITFIEESTYFEALKIMIQSGADVLLPEKWLSDRGFFTAYGTGNWSQRAPEEHLCRRFPNIKPKRRGHVRGDNIYAVSDLLEHFSGCFRFRLDTLKALVLQREAQILASKPPSQIASSIVDGMSIL